MRELVLLELDSNAEMSEWNPGIFELELSILQQKIQEGLPSQVQSKLAEVAALKSTPKKVCADNNAHQVEL